LDNPNDSEDDGEADFESDIEPDNGFEDPESAEQRDVSATPNVFGLIRPTRRSSRHVEKVQVAVKAMEMRRNMGIKKK